MELTIEQSLQQGVAAHNAGNLQDAERFYRAILQFQPEHPDANHNLGVIAVSVDKADAALPLFKTALEANPKIEQFWLSYIDALIKEKQFDDANKVINQAKNQGVAGEKLNVLEVQLASQKKPGNVEGASPSLVQLNALLEHYQNGRFSDAEKLATYMSQEFPQHHFAWKVLGAVLAQTGRSSEALNANQKAVEITPLDPEAHKNLGVILKDLGRLEESEASYRQAIALKSDYAEAHYNLGIALMEVGRLDESEVSYKKAIALQPDYPDAYYNLGGMLQEQGRFEEAEASSRQAIVLKSDYAEAHNNLGVSLEKQERLGEAEASYRQAIVLKPDYAEAYNNLGHTLKEFARLEEAEASYRKALSLKSDYALAHLNLGIALYLKGDKASALKHLEKANIIDPQSKIARLLWGVMSSRKSREENVAAVGGTSDSGAFKGLTSNPLILNRVVEAELIANLYGMSSRELDKTRLDDPRFGRGTCSSYSLFEDARPIIKTLAEDLTRIMKEAVKSDVYIYDSFFNIFGSGGGISPHSHLNSIDKDEGLEIGNQKYSLAYYLCVGDQNCSEPGILKLYDPAENVLPREGMITIIPASREHSAVYGGETDRVMVGVNFYSL